MRKKPPPTSLCMIAATAIAVLCIPSARSVADGQSPPTRERAPVYVPFSDLHVLLQQQPKRVLFGAARTMKTC